MPYPPSTASPYLLVVRLGEIAGTKRDCDSWVPGAQIKLRPLPCAMLQCAVCAVLKVCEWDVKPTSAAHAEGATMVTRAPRTALLRVRF